MRWAALLVAVAACWGARPDAASPRTPPPPIERAPQTYVPPHRAVGRVPLTDFEEAVTRLNDYTDEMCRCADSSCTSAVMNDISLWGQTWQEQHKEWKATEEENKQITEIATRLMECMQRAGSNAPSP